MESVFARGVRNSLEQGNRTREERAIARGEGGERCDQGSNAPLAAVVQHLGSAGGRPHTHDAPVGCIDLTLHEPLGLQLHDQLRDGRRAHLLGARELAQRERAAEDDHGESGQLGGRKSRGVVLATEAAEEMERRGVQAIRERRCLGGGAAGRRVLPGATGGCGRGWMAQYY